MSWTSTLTETYDNYFNGAELEDNHPLIPVGFIEKKVGIRVNINRDATYASAAILSESKLLCIPSDSAAESRTGQALPYPLSDEIRYTAGDLSDFTKEDYNLYFEAYINKLQNWCSSEGSPEELHLLLEYLQKRTLVSDLIEHGVIVKDKYEMFPAAQLRTFVDFCIYTDSEYVSLSKLNSVRSSWQKNFADTMSNEGLCYSSGSIEPILANHAKIDGNAKLISAKDGPRPFQYKGRFLDAEQACTVGYSASAKIHNTIRWLRNRQGFQRYGTTFIAWSTSCRKIIAPYGNSLDEDEEETEVISTEEIYGKKIRNTMAGYMKSPAYKDDAKIVMLGMESATPGRMSINFYEELDGRKYLDNLSVWYLKCLWMLPVKKDEVIRYYVTTPTIHDMSEAVFGIDNVRNADSDKKAEKSVTKQVRRFASDILTCIVNVRTAPEIYVNAAYHRACCPTGFVNKKGRWQRDDWLKCIAVTLAMLKSCYDKEGYKVALNKDETKRDYLFGRLLAVADVIEITASAGTDAQFRQTNAVRLFSAMQQRPATTWGTIREKLEPYFKKIKFKKASDEYRKLIDEINHMADDGVLSDNSPLSPRFLEGYHNQRYELLNKKEG